MAHSAQATFEKALLFLDSGRGDEAEALLRQILADGAQDGGPLMSVRAGVVLGAYLDGVGRTEESRATLMAALAVELPEDFADAVGMEQSIARNLLGADPASG